MIANFIAIIIALVILFFIGLLWLRQNLVYKIRNANAHREILIKKLNKRRDTVPYLLESFRQNNEPTEGWYHLLTERAAFHSAHVMDKEWEFERTLLQFLHNNPIKSVNFLEAKKDIRDLGELIEKEKRVFQEAANVYNEQRKKFPFSLASGIFALQKLSL